MCVTAHPAIISNTRVVAYRTSRLVGGQPYDIMFYLNQARNLGEGPGCMFLHVPAQHGVQVVSGLEKTRHFMDDVTGGLKPLKDVFLGRSSFGAKGMPREVAEVVAYGDDYHIITASRPELILDAIERVPEKHRPIIDRNMRNMAGFYADEFSDYSFAMACFDGAVAQQYPIALGYVPLDDDNLFAAGLDGHDGKVPTVGEITERETFHVAFAIEGVELSHPVRLTDNVPGGELALTSVAGFVDNRGEASNTDYIAAVETLMEGFTGRELAEVMFS